MAVNRAVSSHGDRVEPDSGRRCRLGDHAAGPAYPDEARFRTIGRIEPSLLIVIHTEEDPDPVTGERSGRIISARKATRRERAIYEEK